MCSHLSKSMEPRNWYYSFSGSFFLSLSLLMLEWEKVITWERKGVSTSVKGGSCVSAVFVNRPVYSCCTSAHLRAALSLRLLCLPSRNYTKTHTSEHNESTTQCDTLRMRTGKTIHTLHVPKLIAWKQCFITALAIITALLKMWGWKTGEQHNA